MTVSWELAKSSMSDGADKCCGFSWQGLNRVDYNRNSPHAPRGRTQVHENRVRDWRPGSAGVSPNATYFFGLDYS